MAPNANCNNSPNPTIRQLTLDLWELISQASPNMEIRPTETNKIQNRIRFQTFRCPSIRQIRTTERRSTRDYNWIAATKETTHYASQMGHSSFIQEQNLDRKSMLSTSMAKDVMTRYIRHQTDLLHSTVLFNRILLTIIRFLTAIRQDIEAT